MGTGNQDDEGEGVGPGGHHLEDEPTEGLVSPNGQAVAIIFRAGSPARGLDAGTLRTSENERRMADRGGHRRPGRGLYRDRLRDTRADIQASNRRHLALEG